MPPFTDTSGSNRSPSRLSRQSHSNYYQPPQPQHPPQPSSRPIPRPVLKRKSPSDPFEGDYVPPYGSPRPQGERRPKATSRRRPAQPDTVPLHPGGMVSRSAPAAIAPSKKSGGYMLAGGSIALALMAILLPNADKSPSAKPEMCQEQVQAQSVLSRSELSKLLSVPERSTKQAVRDVIAEPFCLMPSVAVREGVEAEREAYPLEFDPQTWLIVLYEGDEYAGYDFSFRK